jgi:NAD(P)-dependent dehydrogenase (short-subunit alcohol dehydrogenase family)
MSSTPPAPAGGRLAGRHAFVTGASRGIGRAIALAMAAEGARLTLAATNAALLGQVARECPTPAGQAHRVQPLDVTDRAACFAAIDAAADVDVLVNAAGIHRAGPFLDFAEADFRALFEVNVMGTIHLTQAALPGMIARKRGRVINLASTAGKWASANQSGYNVSKHAVVGLTRCVALETGRTGVTVNAICPGFVQTDMLTDGIGAAAAKAGKSLDEYLAPTLTRVAMGRVLQVDELTGLAVFLASDESSGMTGQSLLVDGGMLYV